MDIYLKQLFIYQNKNMPSPFTSTTSKATKSSPRILYITHKFTKFTNVYILVYKNKKEGTMTFCLDFFGPKPYPIKGSSVPSEVTHGNAKLLLYTGSTNEI